MTVTSPHTFITRDNSTTSLDNLDDDPSLGQLFHIFPAVVWAICKSFIFISSLIFAFLAVLVGVTLFFRCILPNLIKWIPSGKLREVWKENIGRLRKSERFDTAWKWWEHKIRERAAEAVGAEELGHLGSHDGGREGSVAGETLFEGEDTENRDQLAGEREETEFDMGNSLGRGSRNGGTEATCKFVAY